MTLVVFNVQVAMPMPGSPVYVKTLQMLWTALKKQVLLVDITVKWHRAFNQNKAMVMLLMFQINQSTISNH